MLVMFSYKWERALRGRWSQGIQASQRSCRRWGRHSLVPWRLQTEHNFSHPLGETCCYGVSINYPPWAPMFEHLISSWDGRGDLVSLPLGDRAWLEEVSCEETGPRDYRSTLSLPVTPAGQ